MTRHASFTLSDILRAMAKSTKDTFTMEEMGALFGVYAETMRYHVKKLVISGDIKLVQRARNEKAAVYALANPCSRGLGDIVPAFKTTCWTPPMRNYEAGLRAAANLAMATRRA